MFLVNKLLTLATESEPLPLVDLDKILKDQQQFIDGNKKMLENFDNMSLIGKLKENVIQLNDNLSNIGNFINKIMHPSLILKDVWTFTVSNSYYVCLVLCVGGLVYWIVCGSKKGAVISKASLVTYIIIKAISSV